MTLTSTVTLFPSGRVGGLRAASNPLGGEWQRGLDVGGNGCLAPVRLGPCATGDDDPQRPSTLRTFVPATVRQIVECSTLGRTDVGAYAAQAADVTIEYALGVELFAGAATENPNLTGVGADNPDPTDLGLADTPLEALGCLEQEAATALSGRVAFIHVPPLVSAHLTDRLWRDDAGNWRTVAGNVVVVSPGYSGASIYATGEVWAATETIGTRTFTDRQDNTDQAWADQLALAIFDPCFLATIDTGVTCPSES